MSVNARPSHHAKRKEAASVKTWFVENQIGLSLGFILPVLIAHCFSSARQHTTKFLTLLYHNPNTGQYGIGFDDVYLVSFLAVFFTGLRDAIMRHVFAPFANWYGLSKSKSVRFSEQAWLIVAYAICWPFGMYLYRTSPYWFNLHELWTNWPNREITGPMKGYMLAQLAFWLHQMIVINIEKRRKDHWQMFSHHVVTIGLIYCSYRYGHTRVGHVVLILMDANDVVFTSAKCLKYLKLQTLCDIMFGVFVISWIFCRHIAFGMVCWSVYAHTPGIMTTGCFTGSGENIAGPVPVPKDERYLTQPLVSNSGLVCYNPTVKHLFLSGLLFLEGLMIVWFVMIAKLVVRVILGENAEDTRSDDEEEEEIEEDQQPIELEVDGENLYPHTRRAAVRNGRSRTRQRSGGASPSTQSDRKRFLDRIGCEKKID
ncbi:hypothetical protein FDECE_317 [Fusarium decemcellulare]|nr:hypothetical protein FDECE_317 [Fusarium decemcellulare]